MSNKVMFVALAMFVCLGLSSTPASARSSRMLLDRNITGLSGDALIDESCARVFDVPACKETLKAAPEEQKHNNVALASYALRFTEDSVANLSETFKNITTNQDIGRGFQATLAVCLVQFTSMDHLIEDSINALQANHYDDTADFLLAGLASLDICSKQVQKTMKNEWNGTGPDAQIARDQLSQTGFIEGMMDAAINLVRDQIHGELPDAN